MTGKQAAIAATELMVERQLWAVLPTISDRKSSRPAIVARAICLAVTLG